MNEHGLWLIRHAESTWNAVGRWQGQADPPLSERGRGQAEELAAALCGEGLEVLIASDLVRAAETARIVGGVLGLEPRLEPRLRELDAGSWSGLTREEILRRDRAALTRFDAGEPGVPAGGAESRDDVARRARAALAELLPGIPGCRVGIVCHEGVLSSLVPGLELGHAEWRVVSHEVVGPGEAAR